MNGTNFLTRHSLNRDVYVSFSNEIGLVTDCELRGSITVPTEPIFAKQATIRVPLLSTSYINTAEDGQIPMWNIIPAGPASSGVDSFNSRTGPVLPAFGDYTKSLIPDLINVDNTADINKPISLLTQIALNAKKNDSINTGKISGRFTAGTGVLEEITVGTGLTLGPTGILTSEDIYVGTVQAFTFTDGSGIAGVVTTPTTTPTLSLSLNNITPSSVISTGLITGSNLTGINTGDQTITLTGDVIGSGVGSFATVISNNAITTAKILNGTVDLVTKVTGILPILNGGTNISSYTQGDLLTVNAAGALVKLPIGTANKLLTSDGIDTIWQSIKRVIVSVSANQTLANNSDMVLASGTISLALPVAPYIGQTIDIKNTGTGTVTITGNIDTGTTFAVVSHPITSAVSVTLLATSATEWIRI